MNFHGAVEAIGKAVQDAGEQAWAIASAWMTNEELWLVSQLARALVALDRIERERLHHDRLERLRIALDQARRSDDIAGDDAMHRVEVAVGAEAAMLRRDLVEDDAEREHVAARSTSRPRHCSGAMYANLPLMMPLCVSTERAVAFAMPKSSSFTAPS